MRKLTVLGATLLVLASSASAQSLNKCIDARGKVTYSNLPCQDARETRAVEIDPAPPAPAAAPRAAPVDTRKPDTPAPIRLETQRTSGKPAPHASSRPCDALTEKMGRLLDKMDQARRNGYTQKQMDAWNAEVRELERKKQQAHCF